MEAGVGVNSPEFLQKKIERLKTALEEANALMDRQVTERDEARAQVESFKRENDELKRRIAELEQGGGSQPSDAGEAEAAPAALAIDPALEQELRDRIAQLEQELRDRTARLEQESRDRAAQLETERLEATAGAAGTEQELRDRAIQLQSELDASRRDLEAVRRDLESSRGDADTARRDADAARADASAARAAASAVVPGPGARADSPGDLPSPGPFVSQEVIRSALDNDDFVLFCQPVFSLQAERVTQYELLLRLRDKDGRMVRPFGFLEPADRFGLMAEIDRWVVQHALDLLASDPTGELRLEVNIAAQSLGDPELPALIEQHIAVTDLDPARLILEVSENIAAANLQDCQRLAKQLRGLGCGFALDDFGSTFASFRHLRDLPINFLKIDGDLVVTVTESRTGQLTIKSLVELAKGLGAETIAEFVSDDQTLEFLREQGVGYAQGYRIGRPRPIDEILNMEMQGTEARQPPKRVQRPALGTGEEAGDEAESDAGSEQDEAESTA